MLHRVKLATPTATYNLPPEEQERQAEENYYWRQARLDRHAYDQREHAAPEQGALPGMEGP